MNSVADLPQIFERMTDAQRRQYRCLRQSNFRFNTILVKGRNFVLQNRVELLTGKKYTVNVAIITDDGCVEHNTHDVAA